MTATSRPDDTMNSTANPSYKYVSKELRAEQIEAKQQNGAKFPVVDSCHFSWHICCFVWVLKKGKRLVLC